MFETRVFRRQAGHAAYTVCRASGFGLVGLIGEGFIGGLVVFGTYRVSPVRAAMASMTHQCRLVLLECRLMCFDALY